jgi:hypothetical protein
MVPPPWSRGLAAPSPSARKADRPDTKARCVYLRYGVVELDTSDGRRAGDGRLGAGRIEDGREPSRYGVPVLVDSPRRRDRDRRFPEVVTSRDEAGT